jgi:hypothetical protein
VGRPLSRRGGGIGQAFAPVSGHHRLNPEYVDTFQEQLGIRGKGRNILAPEGGSHLRESEATYRAIFEDKKGQLTLENAFLWNQTLL